MKITIVLLLSFITFKNYASEAVGFYSDGQLRNANSILDENIDIIKLFSKREKLYTTDEMLELIGESAKFVRDNFPTAEKVQIGDLSGVKGGKATRHVSHQNGLDADVVYLRVNENAQDESNSEWSENFVSGSKASKNYHPKRNYDLLKFIHSNFAVGRIFVDAAIKKSLCNVARERGEDRTREGIEFLRTIRPAKHHHTHFHVRLECAAKDTNCRAQAPAPAGSGCSEGELTLLLENELSC